MTSPKLNSLLVIVNLALLVAVGYLLGSRRPPPSVAEVSARATSSPPRGVIRGASPKILRVTNTFHWGQLESENYRDYIARLRAVGCPEQTIRDIVIADLDTLLAPRVHSIYGRRQDPQYWHPEEQELANDLDHREWSRQERAINREKREVILELLGIDLVRERMKILGHQDYYERRLSFLPEDKRSAVRLILDKYDDWEDDYQEKALVQDEPLSAEDQAQLRQLRRQRDAELAGVLTPAERDQYELWTSPSANLVRYAFYGMDGTEEEFLSVYQLRKGFDAQWDPDDLDWNNDATLERWNRAKQEMDAQIKEALGEDRYALYQRGEDPEFHQLNATVTCFKLPRENAAEVYEMKRVLLETRGLVRNDPSFTPQQKEMVLREMAVEAEKAVRGVLGERAFTHYLQHGMGQWLGN